MPNTLDEKIAHILEDPSCSDFILADAKDADMAFGLSAPGRSPEQGSRAGRLRTLDEYRQTIREVVGQGLVDIIKALDLTYPRRVVGMGGIWQWPENRDLPDNFEMICEYPQGLTVYVLGTQGNRVGVDHLIRGYRGTLYFTDEGWVAKDKYDKVLARHKKTGAEDTHPHHTNLHNHMRSGEPLNCPVELGVAGVMPVVMANESWRTGQMMGWDPEAQAMTACHTLQHNPYPMP